MLRHEWSKCWSPGRPRWWKPFGAPGRSQACSETESRRTAYCRPSAAQVLPFGSRTWFNAEVDIWTGADARRLRKVALRMSLREFADHLGVSHRTISKWEQAGSSRVPRPHMQAVLDTALRQADPSARSRFADGARVSGGQAATVSAPDGWAADLGHVDDLDRRTMLKALGVGTVTMAAGNKMLSPTADRTGRVGKMEVDSLLEHTARLRRLDDFLGGADTYGLYMSELRKTTDFVRSATCTSEVRASLTSVVAEQEQLAGWAAFDAGMYAEAYGHYTASLAAAREVEDSTLAGNALAFLAYQYIATDKPRVDLATESYATAKQAATPKVRTLLLERMAWTHAVAGQAKETEAALSAARESLGVEDDREEPDWVFWVDDVELEIMAGRCWTALRRTLRAVPTLESVLKRYDDTHARDKSMYLTWLAHAYIDAGEVEQGAAVTSRALDLASGVASVRPLQHIDTVLGRLRPHGALPEVADVVEQRNSRVSSIN